MAIYTYRVTESIMLRNGDKTQISLGVFTKPEADAIQKAVGDAWLSRRGILTLVDRSNPERPIPRSFSVGEITRLHGESVNTASPLPSRVPSLAEVVQHDGGPSFAPKCSLLLTYALPVALAAFALIGAYWKTQSHH